MSNSLNLCFACMTNKQESETKCPNCGHVNHQKIKDCYLLEGTLLHERYIIGKVLGHGGFGVTYIAYDKRISAVVAIKEYLPGDYSIRTHNKKEVLVYDGEKKSLFQNGLEKFLSEAKTMAKYNHYKGVVTTKDFIQENNTAYIVMEFLDGETVEEYLNRNEGRVDYFSMLEIIYPVMETMILLHDDGIIHRDISPDNIYITKDNKIKLIDFGAARESDENEKNYSIVLEPGYAPEEQYRSKGIQGPFTDVYALAATMYKMLTGVTPVESMERSLGDKDLQPLIDFGLKLSKRQIAIIEKGLALQSKDRYQDVTEFKKAIEKASSRARAKWTAIRNTAVAIGLVLLLVFSGYKGYTEMYLTYIPDVKNSLIVDVTDYLERHDISYSITYTYDETFVDKTVVKQSTSDTRVKPNAVVELQVNDTDLRKVTFSDDVIEKHLQELLGKDELLFQDVKYIEKLDLSELGITDIKGLENLVALEQLNLSNNSLTNADVLASIKNLKQLNLSGNHIMNTEFVSQLEYLFKLDLSNNQLVSERTSIQSKSLNELYLQSNYLMSLEIDAPNIIILDVSDNVLVDIMGISELLKLTKLDLSNNLIPNVQALVNLVELNFLDLSDNNIVYVKPLTQLSNLKLVDLSYNNLNEGDANYQRLIKDFNVINDRM